MDGILKRMIGNGIYKWIIGIMLFAFLAVTVGLPLAAERNAAVIPLIKHCSTVTPLIIDGGVAGVDAAPALTCALGGVIGAAVPGVIGAGLIGWRVGKR